VLIVDDEEYKRIVFKTISDGGHGILRGTDGRQHWRSLKGRFDLVIMDMRLPDLDGAATRNAYAMSEIVTLLACHMCQRRFCGGELRGTVKSGMNAFLM
jgi:CheY-like chemotaxis protein